MTRTFLSATASSERPIVSELTGYESGNVYDEEATIPIMNDPSPEQEQISMEKRFETGTFDRYRIDHSGADYNTSYGLVCAMILCY